MKEEEMKKGHKNSMSRGRRQVPSLVAFHLFSSSNWQPQTKTTKQSTNLGGIDARCTPVAQDEIRICPVPCPAGINVHE
jgi:hypothetical protein